jgi:hypothetical protein
MKYIILAFLILSTASLKAQIFYDYPSSYQYAGVAAKNTFLLPADTILTTVQNVDKCRQIAKKDGIIYSYSCTLNRWIQLNDGTAYIQNQSISTQAANYWISGNSTAGKYNANVPANAAFKPYYSFTHDGSDTTKQRWSIGLLGVDGSPIINNGNEIKFRSHNNSGAFLKDVMTLQRDGGVIISNSLMVGSTTPLINGALTVGGNLGVTGSIGLTGGIAHRGSLTQSGTVTITTDYTVLGTDLYININNTSDCTIIIPRANPSIGFDGRVLHIKKISNNDFIVTVVVSGGIQTIDGISSLVISSYNESKTLHDDSSNWFTY